jgi:hypothetical protein
MDGKTNGWMDGWMDEANTRWKRMDGWDDREAAVCAHRQRFSLMMFDD